MKRLLSILLVFGMLIPLAACGQQEAQISDESKIADTLTPEITPEPIQDAEILAAIEAGLVPETQRGDYEAQMNYRDFCVLLDAFVNRVYPECASTWADVCAKYHDAEDAMSRMEGALVLFYFAECTGLDSIGYEYNIPLGDLVPADVNTDEGITWDYPLLPDTMLPYFNQTLADSENYSWRCGLDYRDNTNRFIQCFSYGNGKTYFDYDENHSQYLGKAFTREDAIKAVERLYETARFTLYVPVENSKSTVSEETLWLAEQMPQATDQELPYWTGYSLQGRSWSAGFGVGMRYEKEEIDVLAGQGFNFVRAPLNFNDIFHGTDTSKVNEAFLENMDRLIEYCAENGVHLCFDLHDMPGFTTDGNDSNDCLFTDDALQQIFVDFWTVLAKRYQDIPSNLLSFNLLNEPHDREELTDAVYSKVMKKAIHAIRDISAERLIFVDMLGVVDGIPVYGLTDEHIVQTIHPYYLANGAQEWPVYMISGFIHRNNGEFQLKGSFQNGDRLSLEFSGVHAASSFTAYVDGVPVAEYRLGTEQVGENYCTGIGEEGTGGEFRSYEGAVWDITLPENCAELTITQENGWWYQLENLLLETGEFSIHVTVNNRLVSGDEVPSLVVDADGTLRTENKETLRAQSREWLEEFIQKYLDFTAETGVLVMVQEFGYDPSNGYRATLNSADNFLTVLQANGIPWCSWSSSLGPILDKREVTWNQLVFSNDSLLRKEAKYTNSSENWLLDMGLLEVFQKHMG